MVTIYKVAAILVFPKIAVYFKLNYFKLIHLQAIMLSSFNFTYFALNHTNLPQKLSFGLVLCFVIRRVMSILVLQSS